MATYATQAGDNVVTFLRTVYPSATTSDLYKKLVITPMIGVNDVSNNIFT